MIPSKTRLPSVVAQAPVCTETKQLTVSTIRMARDHYETAVFDDSTDKRHAGWFIGGYVINQSQKRAASRDEAMEQHREALYAARTEEPFPPNGGHSALCAYAGGISSRCTCSGGEGK